MEKITIEMTLHSAKTLQSTLLHLLSVTERVIHNKTDTLIYEAAKNCPSCGQINTDFHLHHVLPKSLGGLDQKSNILEICSTCHAKIHSPHLLRTSATIKSGLAKAKKKAIAEGRIWQHGRLKFSNSDIQEVVALGNSGMSIRKIEKHLEK